MAAAATPAPPADRPLKGVQPLRAGQGNSFLWRRLHSLSGIIPIGAFLVEHIISNFETWNGPLAYAQQVKLLNSLPLVRFLEWGLIFIPLAFHALYGVFIAFRGARQRQRLSVGVELGLHLAAHHRADRLRVHHPACVAAALRRRPASGASGRGLRQGAARAFEPLVSRDLRDRDDCDDLALCLRHLALRGQVGHHAGRQGPQEVWLCLHGVWNGAVPDGPDQHLRGGL